ncbi:response regulator transcription factor [Aureispira]|nr:response regulator transcription factor [Aureispira sp.]
MMSNDYKILIVDDEVDILEFVTYNLTKAGFQVFSASDGIQAIKKAQEIKPHLILLDIMMPDLDGIEVCKELRSISQIEDTIIAFLTARSEDYSQIVGFEVGGDDYISKPIRPRVLISRVNALLRRFYKKNNTNLNKNLIQVADINIDREQYIVTKHGSSDKLVLPKKEFELLALLASKPGKVFSREEIFNKIWGMEVIVGNRTIDVHIRKIREKIGSGYITTIKGIGYKFEF